MVGSVWTDISSMLGTSPVWKKVRRFTQEQELSRATQHAQEGDIVGPFMGSAQRLGKALMQSTLYRVGQKLVPPNWVSKLLTWEPNFHSQFPNPFQYHSSINKVTTIS